ncbi:MAG: 4-hydroxythreonine-4-phosphate dehydrogenase PdxA [Hyphomicrobium sp.]
MGAFGGSGVGPHTLPPLALTMGDPAGIGLEIALKAWLGRDASALPPFCFYGSADALRSRALAMALDVPVEIVNAPSEAARTFGRALPVVDQPLAVAVIAGAPSSRNAPATIAAITHAVADVHAGRVRAVVTNPIAKSVLYSAGFKYPGHTEFLASLAETHWPGRSYHPVMMLACDALKVVPLTIHVPLSDVPHLVTRDLILETARITADALKRDFAIAAPRIAVAGLNPHAGEDGSIGVEDRDVIAPAIVALVAEGLCVTGPLPADTMFHEAARATYDAAICMYHDQALIPIKTLAFDRGVNVTLGLPFVRTSPDHGTAFNIAKAGTASAQSLIEALHLADRMTAHTSEARV